MEWNDYQAGFAAVSKLNVTASLAYLIPAVGFKKADDLSGSQRLTPTQPTTFSICFLSTAAADESGVDLYCA